jgi:transposase
MVQLNDLECGKILALRKKGLSMKEIAKETEISKSTMGLFLKRYEKRGSIVKRKSPGRPSILKIENLILIKKIHDKMPKISAPKLNGIFRKKTT